MEKKWKKLYFFVPLIVIFGLFGCASMENARIGDLQSELKQKDQQLAAKDRELNMLKSSVGEKDMTIKNYRGQIDETTKAQRNVEMRAPSAELFPPGAKPNECYARVFRPPVFKNVTERVLARSASERLEVIPAKYQWFEEKILVQEASQRLTVIPAVYDWVEEKVLVKAASSRMEEIPAKYEWKSEKILIKPAQTVWKTGRGLIEKVDNSTGEIMCLVEIPASYKTVKSKVMTNAPKTVSVEIPAEYQTVKKRVMVKPPTTQVIEIPAAYKTVKVRKMVSAPKERRIAIPEEHSTVTRTEQVSEGSMEWRRVLCETNVSPAVISRVQNALDRNGHNPGPIDGVLGADTRGALTSFQKQKGLPAGALTYETLEKLGVKPGN